MTIAYFDTIGGISGDMTLGAFLHAGVPLDYLRQELLRLPIGGYSLEQKLIQRNAITAVKLNVVIDGENAAVARMLMTTAIILMMDIRIIKAARPIRITRAVLRIFLFSLKSLPSHQGSKNGLQKFLPSSAPRKRRSITQPSNRYIFMKWGRVDSIVDIAGTAICLEYFGIQAVY